MLNVLFLISIILGISGQNIVKKAYTEKTGENGVFLSSLLISVSATLFFVFTSKEFNFTASIIPYAIGFALSYAAATAFAVFAISCGSLSLTSLITSYSLLAPTLYGLVFLKDPIGKGFIIGLVLLIISLALINKKDENIKFSFKWIIFVILAFLGNGACSTVQMMQQEAFDGKYKNEFMIISLIIVSLVMAILTFAREKQNIKSNFKLGWHFSILGGLLNGMVNLFVMILSGRIPVALMFPLVSAGGLVITYLVSKFFYKEILSKMQFVGFLFGLAAVVFLNI